MFKNCSHFHKMFCKLKNCSDFKKRSHFVILFGISKTVHVYKNIFNLEKVTIFEKSAHFQKLFYFEVERNFKFGIFFDSGESFHMCQADYVKAVPKMVWSFFLV